MKYIFSILVASAFCACSKDKLVNDDEIIKYLRNDPVATASASTGSDMKFWRAKLDSDTGSFVNMLQVGSGHLSLFKTTGNIGDLEKADSFLRRASQKLNHTSPEILQALAQLSITRHKFRDAAAYNAQAKQAKASPYVSALLDFDSALELGQYDEAEKAISSLIGRNSFDYLVRRSRWEDVKGNSEASIRFMESALKKLESTNKLSLQCWTLSRLGDMYVHAGRVKDAYAAYRAVLEKDPSFTYALKGMAWIAYSNDKNIELARKITAFLQLGDHNPEHELFLAELAGYQNRTWLQQYHLEKFAGLVAQPSYGDMYNKYLVDIYSENPLTLDKALSLALRETTNRPTPETYSWLSWVYQKMGENKKALELYRTYVEGRTHEPDALLKGAFIYHAAGHDKKARTLIGRCDESTFELGLVKMRQLAELKKSLK
jgi:tetratricopeptide (TPR) repeat protein